MIKDIQFSQSYVLLFEFDTDNEADLEEMNSLYKKVEEANGCEIEIPLTEQFWGGYMARFKDPFGCVMVFSWEG